MGGDRLTLLGFATTASRRLGDFPYGCLPPHASWIRDDCVIGLVVVLRNQHTASRFLDSRRLRPSNGQRMLANGGRLTLLGFATTASRTALLPPLVFRPPHASWIRDDCVGAVTAGRWYHVAASRFLDSRRLRPTTASLPGAFQPASRFLDSRRLRRLA